ncbi:hypothetical protein SAMN05421790_101763 [Kroppenstedtia eburnea]|uniref:Uncharacterized protein n=1 Tax=Kroppenstedtia eburnea TaxID=714067 RepID=A0A1N7J671_9BACL|nr:hypothetical protein SAMN05421790_101763 [Kroppenstedtia eburnea]
MLISRILGWKIVFYHAPVAPIGHKSRLGSFLPGRAMPSCKEVMTGRSESSGRGRGKAFRMYHKEECCP